MRGTSTATPQPRRTSASRRATPDQRILDRYRYLLRTAPLETIEAAHEDAFASLSDEQRASVYEELSRGVGTGERPLSSEPATIARSASRRESRRPGALESILQSAGVIADVAPRVVSSSLVGGFLPWDAAYDDRAS